MLTILPSFFGVIFAVKVFEVSQSYLIALVTYGVTRGAMIILVALVASPLMRFVGSLKKGNA